MSPRDAGADDSSSNPYVSPDATNGRHQATGSAGAAWGLLFGSMQGATFGAMGGVTLSVVLTIFFAVTRLPGWFGPADGMLIRLILYFVLSAMVGGVAGMVTGAIGGVVVGLSSMRVDRNALPRVGALVFAVAGAVLTAISWGREMTSTDNFWRFALFALAIGLAATYAAAAGRRTGFAIRSILDSLEREERLNELTGPGRRPK